MLSSYQEGHRARPNAGASLAGNGHISPHSRHPKAGAIQYAHRPGPTARPGPAPVSARQAAANHARQAQAKRFVDQMQAECRRAIQQSNDHVMRQAASISLSQLEAGRRQGPGGAQNTEITIPGTFRTADVLRYRQGNLWIFSTTFGNGWQDHVYYVFNPDTGAMLEFGPESALKGHRTASRKSQIQATAAYTGRVGGYLEKTYAVVAVGAVGAAAAAEVGGYYWVTEEAAPFVSRMAVRGWQVGKPLARAAFNRARQGFAMRAVTDLGTQLGAGFLTNEGSIGERSEKALYGVNITSVFVAGITNTSGLQMSTLAKWLVPASAAAVSNGLSGSGENRDKYGSYFHLVDLSNGQEAAKYAFNIVLGTLLDRGRDGLVDKGAEKVASIIARTSGRPEEVALRYVQMSKMALCPSLGLATSFESGKKRLEQWWDAHNEAVKKEEDARLARTNSGKIATPRPPHR